MTKPNAPTFDADITLVDMPSESSGDPLTLFESESETGELEPGTSGFADDSVASSGALPFSAPARERGPLPLDRLLQRLGRIEWPESVAIVEALCGVLTARQSQRVPEISRVAITFEGTVIAGTAASKEAVGPVLARMIHALAAGGSVPAPLRLFVTKWASANESHSIAEFAKELAYFTRSDGPQLIQAVYERAMAAGPVHVEPVGVSPLSTSKEPPRIRARDRSKPRSRIPFVAAAAVVALGIVATGVLAWRYAPASGGASPLAAPGASNETTGVGDRTLATGEGAPAGATRPSNAARAGGRATRAGASASQATGAGFGREIDLQPFGDRPGGSRATSPVSSAVRASIGTPLAPSPRVPPSVSAEPSRAVRSGAPRSARRDEGGPPVYSSADTDVTPPAFLHPQLPGQLLSGAQPDMNTIELIVSETGSVERVRLLSIPKRMPDMMLLSGAKNWAFEPALKDGQSVRYRLELSWAATP